MGQYMRCATTQFAVAATNQTRQRHRFFRIIATELQTPHVPYPTGLPRYKTTYLVLTGCSRGKLGRFTVHSLLPSSDEMRSAEMKSDEMR